jgi:EpsI family protein
VPIVANWVRAYIIVMLGHLSDNRIAHGVDHLIYGWVFFGFVMLLMFWIGQRWREDDHAAPAPAPAGAIARPAREPWAVLAGVMLATALWPLAQLAILRLDAAAAPQLGSLQVEGWQAAEGGLTDWQPDYRNPPAMLHRSFRQGGAAAGLYVGYYRDQNHGNKLVTSTNSLVSSSDQRWVRSGGGTQSVDFAGTEVSARRTILRGPDGERLLVWHWYWINGRPTASDHWAKVHTALSRLLGRGDDSAVVMVYAPLEAGRANSEALARFAREAAPSIERLLRETRERR